MATIEVYGAQWCGFCLRALMLLDRKGADYRWIDVDETPGSRDEMKDRGGGRTIPQIFIDDAPIGGCDELYALEQEGRLDAMLGAATGTSRSP